MRQKRYFCPGVVFAALRGGSGKTIISVGIIAALKKLGKKVSAFKKGPDYIDAGWLALAAGRSCYNLDNFLIDKEHILNSYRTHTSKSNIAVIEGNRGLYDGVDLSGSTSTAELAKLLNLPVILCIDCTKSTRTMAAAVLGCIQFDPGIRIKGVILNRVAGKRHEKILRESIQRYCSIPVIGALPKLRWKSFPERHMGLVPTSEHTWAKDSVDEAAQIISDHIDIDSLIGIAADNTFVKSGIAIHDSGDLNAAKQLSSRGKKTFAKKQEDAPVIGIFKDSAFQFYYPENIEALKDKGAELSYISPLSDKSLPDIDALYIGGGFPETHAEKLTANKSFRKAVKFFAENGLPIYAECGGLMYLGNELVLEEKSFAMAGVLPIVFGFCKKPQGHGYTIVKVEGKNPYYKTGEIIKGHEFHYSRVIKWNGNRSDLIFSMQKGIGFYDKRDGLCYKNVLATYTHVHALSVPAWADAMATNALEYKKNKGSN